MTGAPVFARALGDDFGRLPECVRTVHAPEPHVELRGAVDVEGASGALARIVARLFGFPGSAAGVEAQVRIERAGEGEIWTRAFGDARFVSRVRAGAGPGTLIERFGPFSFDIALAANERGFAMEVTGWRIFGVRAPRALAPRSNARGFARDDGAYGFDVAIDLPFGGRLVRYSGWLRPV
ncbi:DUF4166 domain-containing protein [Chenggangzhangella methanolivorans]|uniref:DUF4166 domain-containing protein n=1 Tax=Chenggangzhangella methanolivorans TaxID=1437009 RepID=A0A9E6ULM3_9HYPH|nr:DUF4166 domain-containing protein [Chenggangzhangella methanolivorans]QZN98353.1 DUF4166 domain-containing protein [Chenggangzhangella methanolivorans]